MSEVAGKIATQAGAEVLQLLDVAARNGEPGALGRERAEDPERHERALREPALDQDEGAEEHDPGGHRQDHLRLRHARRPLGLNPSAAGSRSAYADDRGPCSRDFR